VQAAGVRQPCARRKFAAQGLSGARMPRLPQEVQEHRARDAAQVAMIDDEDTLSRFDPGYLFTKIEPGSFGDLKSPDEREPDCHKWLKKFNAVATSFGESGWNIHTDSITMRDQYIERYGFVIPTRVLIEGIIKYGPVIDLGCGNGYLSFLIQSLGGDVIAMDHTPPSQGKNKYWEHRRFNRGEGAPDSREWIKVLNGTVNEAVTYERTLLLSWPNLNSKFAYNAAKAYKGKTMIYIGEGDGGCTADDSFHELLENEWTEVEHLPMLQHWGLHDYATVYAR
jgi:hypothetical protein